MAPKSEARGLVFKIQRHSLHDGPGIRTLVFLKGCLLKCLWCFNPESHSTTPQIVHYPEKCIGCRLCLEVCPVPGAIEEVSGNGEKRINRTLCDNCGDCAKACSTGGMTRIGEYMDVDEVVGVIQKDKVFYDRSGGGVTLSGGELTLQPGFAERVLKKCRSEGIHTAIETCGYASWTNLKRILTHTDLVLYDLKIMDPEKHRQFTGVDNETILNNAKRIAQTGIPMIARIPVIPGYNDTEENLSDTAAFIKEQLKEALEVHLLPYELMGVGKYERLETEYLLNRVTAPSDSRMEQVKAMFEAHGLNVKIHG